MRDMPSITIRDVPQEVRDELAAQAALAGRSLQAYLRERLIEMGSRPDPDRTAEIIDRARERVNRMGSNLSVEQILEYRDAGRREP